MTQTFTQADFWNTRYQDETYTYGEQPNDLLAAHGPLFQPGHTVLSLAEGEGRNGVFLARRGCVVRGVDFSSEGRRKALRLAAKHGVALTYDLADLTTYDPGTACWDAVVMLFCHLAPAPRGALLRVARAALKPGGLFLLEGYNPAQLAYDSGGPKDQDHLFVLAELQAAFAGWDLRVAHDILREVHEGSGHQGLSSVTQVVAFKPA